MFAIENKNGTTLYQWDLNRRLIVNDENCVEVHFAYPCDKETLALIPYEENNVRYVDIPNILFTESGCFHVYACSKIGDFSCTFGTDKFRVNPRPKPSGYVYTETEARTYDLLAKRLSYLENEGLAEVVSNYIKENPIEAGASKEEKAQIQQNKEDIANLEKNKLSTSELNNTINTALTEAKKSGAFDGERGTGILKVITSPSAVEYADENGYWIVDYYTIPLQTVKNQTKVEEVFKGDIIQYDSTQWLVDRVTTNTVYLHASTVSLKGSTGAKGEDGRVGKDGYTPQKGTDYFTEEDKQELIESLLTMMGNVAKSAKIGEVTLLASEWIGTDRLYSQVVTVEGATVTENSQVDLTPTAKQLEIFYEKDILLVTENEGGVVTVYLIGQKPVNDYTIQVTITEVES